MSTKQFYRGAFALFIRFGVSMDPQVIKDQGLTQAMEDHQSDIPRWFGENSCAVTWQGRNSAGQYNTTNNTQPTGEHQGNQMHEAQTWQPISQHNMGYEGTSSERHNTMTTEMDRHQKNHRQDN